MSNDPRLTPLAASLPASMPFVGPEAQERSRGTKFDARLGANELGFGPSPLAIKAMQDAASEAWMYADPESYDLRDALADSYDVPPECIVIGEGIDALLGNLVRLFVTHGDAVVTSAGAYPTFNYHVAGFGGTLHTVPYTGDHEDPSRLIAKAREVGAKLVYIANPDNPMGTMHAAREIERMVAAVPDDCLLILDEAYIEFAPEGDRSRPVTTGPTRHSDAYVFQGIWPRWCTRGVRRVHAECIVGIQQSAQSLWDVAGVPRGGKGRAFRRRTFGRHGGASRKIPRTDRLHCVGKRLKPAAVLRHELRRHRLRQRRGLRTPNR